MRCLAAPTPMWQSKMCPNLQLTKSEPRGTVRTAFIENLGGAHMHSTCQAPTPITRWVQMAALGATICNAFNQVVGSVTLVSKPCQLDDHRQATRQEKWWAPSNYHIYSVPMIT